MSEPLTLTDTELHDLEEFSGMTEREWRLWATVRNREATIAARDAEIAGANRVIARMKESGRELAHNAREEIAALRRDKDIAELAGDAARVEWEIKLTEAQKQIADLAARLEKALHPPCSCNSCVDYRAMHSKKLAQPTTEEVRDDEA